MDMDEVDRELPARFDKREALGLGLCGTVWAAVDRQCGALVAIKSLPRALFEERRLAYPPLEASLALRHAHVVQVLQVVHEADRILVVQEHLGGGDLFSCLARDGI